MDYTSRRGAADVPALASEFRVSAATIRRDLQALHEQQRLVRTHGGAVANGDVPDLEPLFDQKARERMAEKEAIADVAVTLIGEGEVVVLDSGSTTLALARRLKSERHLTVVTTDLKIALELNRAFGPDVVIVGGNVRPQLFSVVGPLALRTLSELHADHAFLGADAIHLDFGLTNASLDEVDVKQLVMQSAERTTLLADHAKFERRSLAKVADLEAFDRIVSDEALDSNIQQAYRETGIDLVLAEMG